MTKQWTLPEVCPACGAARQEWLCTSSDGFYKCGAIMHDGRLNLVAFDCLRNQLTDYKRALEMVCDPDEADRRLAAARAARLGGK